MKFDDPAIADTLNALDEAALDELAFGVVGLDAAGHVDRYNSHEERSSGLPRDQVLGQHFFFAVAPCMNNYLVAERLEEARLDVTMPYVLTFRMRPTPVRLRLIRTEAAQRRWILVWRA